MRMAEILKNAKVNLIYRLTIILSVLVALATVAETWFMGVLLDDILVYNINAFWITVILMIASVVIQYLSKTANIYLSGLVLENMSFYLRKIISDKASIISYSSLENIKTGDFLSLYLSDMDNIKQYLNSIINKSGNIVAAITALIVCVSINWVFTIFCIFAIIAILLLGMLISKPIQKAVNNTQLMRGKLNSHFINLVKNIVAIKSYCLEDKMSKDFISSLNKFNIFLKKEAELSSFSSAFGKLSGGLMYLVMFAGGAYYIFKGELSLGRFFSFAYIFSNIQSIQNIYDIMESHKRAKASLLRINNFLNNNDEDKNGKVIDISESYINYGVYMKNVDFSYNEDKKNIKNISLNVKKGQCVAIVGKSGCGKSTIVKLISGLIKPNSGVICVNGYTNIDDIRKNISVVGQNDYLFPNTILENLKLANPNATYNQIIDACRNADIYDFIDTLPDKMDTLVGELGDRLSGGQRQRICIARAFLKDAPILILDEPTAALDVLTEKSVLKSLKKLMENRSTIIVSHRLSTVKIADYIYCMDNGEIIEKGELDKIISSGIYFDNIEEHL